MAKKKRKKASTRKKATKRKKPRPSKIDTSVLGELDPTSNVQPAWLRERYPEYADPHALHAPLTSVRTFTHQGHEVRITTTYHIEVDGVPLQPHALVDNEGRLLSHAMPFETYGSATDLVRALIDRFPEWFQEESQGGGHNHGGHHS